jgi:hypothetical protein
LAAWPRRLVKSFGLDPPALAFGQPGDRQPIPAGDAAHPPFAQCLGGDAEAVRRLFDKIPLRRHAPTIGHHVRLRKYAMVTYPKTDNLSNDW